MQDLALFAIPRGYLEGDSDEPDAASDRAAGAGKDSASIGVSRSAQSAESYDSVNNFVAPRPTVNVLACSKILEDSSRLPSPALEEALINVLPGLDSNEIDEVRDATDLNGRLHGLNEPLFYNVAYATWDKRSWLRWWLSRWAGWISLDISSHVTMDWNRRDDSTLTELHVRVQENNSFRQPWLSASLHHVAIRGKTASIDHLDTEKVTSDIHELRARITDDDRNDALREATMNWYIKL